MISSPNSEALHADLIAKIENLQAAILSAHPTLPSLLRQIHGVLKENPAVVTLLDDTQIGVIVSGLKKQTKTELVSASLKKTSAKSLKNASLDDL